MDNINNYNKSQVTTSKILLNDPNMLKLHSNLPKKPYCSNDLEFGLKVRKLDYAITQKYIQINNPAYQQALIFDIDVENCFYQFEDKNCPAPNIIIKNNLNGHCHYIYQLEKGFYRNDFENMKVIKYASAIENALCQKLEADLNYVGLVAKNPFSKFWQTTVFEKEYYDLDLLADYLDLSTSKEIEKNININSDLGRNCYIFEELRFVAYKTLKYHLDKKDKFLKFLFYEANKINSNLPNPLSDNEIKAICKSITKFCFSKFNLEKSNKKFSELQSFRREKRTLKFTQKLKEKGCE